MSLNSDPSKHVQGVILRRKVNKESHPPLIFNNTIFYQASSPKHLSIILGNRLWFEEHLKLSKTSRTSSAQDPHLYKTFLGPHLDYGDIF